MSRTWIGKYSKTASSLITAISGKWGNIPELQLIGRLWPLPFMFPWVYLELLHLQVHVISCVLSALCNSSGLTGNRDGPALLSEKKYTSTLKSLWCLKPLLSYMGKEGKCG